MSISDEPTHSQVLHIADLLYALVHAEESIHRDVFSGLSEYRLLISGVKACGFYCPDIDLAKASETWNNFSIYPDDVAKASLVEIRHAVHFLIRNEHHTNSGGPEGGGWIFGAAKSGLLRTISDRLAAC